MSRNPFEPPQADSVAFTETEKRTLAQLRETILNQGGVQFIVPTEPNPEMSDQQRVGVIRESIREEEISVHVLAIVTVLERDPGLRRNEGAVKRKLQFKGFWEDVKDFLRGKPGGPIDFDQFRLRGFQFSEEAFQEAWLRVRTALGNTFD